MSWGWSLDQVYMTSMQEVKMRVGVWHGVVRKLHPRVPPVSFLLNVLAPNLHLKVTLLRTLLQAVNEQALPQPYLFMHGAHTETIMVAHHVCVCVCVCVKGPMFVTQPEQSRPASAYVAPSYAYPG